MDAASSQDRIEAEAEQELMVRHLNASVIGYDLNGGEFCSTTLSNVINELVFITYLFFTSLFDIHMYLFQLRLVTAFFINIGSARHNLDSFPRYRLSSHLAFVGFLPLIG